MSELFVIFDLDGVLVDTQDAENGALAHVGELMGLSLGTEQRDELFSGKKMQECLDLMAELTGKAPPRDAMPIARAKCEELIGDRLEPLEGVADALDRLRALPLAGMCVASNSPLEIIESRLAKAGILHCFDGQLFSAYDVGAWKPDPRLFSWAAESCGAAAEDCVVVEDSPVGVDAGLGAGMRVLQYTADPAAGPHREGAVAFSSMHELPALIGDARRLVPLPPALVTASPGGTS
ncbi:HAD-IA family hydrolase [Streptomyces sp. HNM0663]|uniref:HAD-IA family hydrolase n=1 Tax=Streptomyces chengmaiensis TaxID=3040919 RepID=A0ABT6HLT1_9ACTN|nr:HAD-IA family hydrolase [Streptomyces chengmaiensis]MDH2389223.1 HAD-IA family hydrolase [Streptomyces chengmaiensis]